MPTLQVLVQNISRRPDSLLSDQSVINIRGDWLDSPLSGLFVAYTERRSTAGVGELLERVFSLKLTKMLAFKKNAAVGSVPTAA